MVKPINRGVIAALAATSLAGALAVGVTAGDTVATFVDDTFARGVFSATKWNVQANASGGPTVNAGAWADYPASGSPAVFQPTLGTIGPGSTPSYSRFGLRMASGSTAAATVTIPQGAQISTSTQAGSFRMRVVRSSSDACGSASFTSGTPVFVVGGATTYGTMLSVPNTGASTITLTPGALSTNPGAPVYLCYEFSLPSVVPTGLTNGDTATVRWTFNAVSS